MKVIQIIQISHTVHEKEFQHQFIKLILWLTECDGGVDYNR